MKKSWAVFLAVLLTGVAGAQTSDTPDTLSAQEAAAVAALLAKDAANREQAAKEQTQQTAPEKEESQESAPEETSKNAVCLPVAFVDIDEAFNEHPRTIAVKEQIREKILAKEREVAQAKEDIEQRRQENARLTALGRELKPFYEHIVIEPHPFLPKIEESADSLALNNLLNRLTFAQTTVLTASPLDTPAQLEDITARIAENKRVIEKQSFFIDNYKYTTREEILKLEQQEVQEILQDIYREIKSFAQKRNIGAIVRKDELLYGNKPVNVTQDFINRLKKSRKYRKRGK
ncbi:hypothetical protein [Candidatus Avelusimicrobium luingense]|uniref:hypothetical protein n=1 Tax=Candidatus Avelusimicrobium luingense TaxID=3416211 RepID=UPI003D13858C